VGHPTAQSKFLSSVLLLVNKKLFRDFRKSSFYFINFVSSVNIHFII